ncbi:MAG: omptin family outer membrane protease [Treponema sp.]|nr:omptin family outer membrane protease [Treponema sp.]
MKTSIKALLLAALFLGAAFPSHSLEADLMIGAGLRAGATWELVFEGEKMISALEWNDRAVPSVGFDARASAGGFFLGLGAAFAIPVRSGEMENRDFLLPGSAATSHYSRHDVYMDKDFSARAEAGYKFRLGTFFLAPFLGFNYGNRKWVATGGFLQYPGGSSPWTGDEPKSALSGPIISYEQAIRYPFVGLEAGLGRRFPGAGEMLVALAAAFFPYVWVDANDVHFMRNTRFYDTLRGGLGLSLGLSAGYFPGRAKGAGFVLRASRESVWDARGTTASAGIGISDENLVLSQGHGAETEIVQWNFFLGMSVPLYR